MVKISNVFPRYHSIKYQIMSYSTRAKRGWNCRRMVIRTCLAWAIESPALMPQVARFCRVLSAGDDQNIGTRGSSAYKPAGTVATPNRISSLCKTSGK